MSRGIIKKAFICFSLLLLIQYSNAEDPVQIDPQFRLIAHRGGVTDNGKYSENSIEALDEAIKRGYTGVEIDVRESKDGVLYLYHNRTFEKDYDSKASGNDLTWAEIQQLHPLRTGGKSPVSLKAYCNHAKGKLQELMIDIKEREPSLQFYQKLEQILDETGFLNSSYFIGHGDYFRGKGPLITMLLREKDEFFQKYGIRTKEYYFLFAGIDEINGQVLKWCKDNGIKVIACANLPFRGDPEPDNFPNAERNIKWLTDWGIIDYQIDSVYDTFFRKK